MFGFVTHTNLSPAALSSGIFHSQLFHTKHCRPPTLAHRSFTPNPCTKTSFTYNYFTRSSITHNFAHTHLSYYLFPTVRFTLPAFPISLSHLVGAFLEVGVWEFSGPLLFLFLLTLMPGAAVFLLYIYSISFLLVDSTEVWLFSWAP